MQTKIKKVILRNLQIEDYKELKKSMKMAYPEMGNSHWEVKDIEILLDLFPEGQLVVLADGKVVGAALSLILDEVLVDKNPNYAKITGNYTFSTHNSEGEILYGIDVFIHLNSGGNSGA